jgi:hypothetical protein
LGLVRFVPAGDAMRPTRITDKGLALGAQIQRLSEPAIARLVAEGEPDERCKSCAFRQGTVPSGCLQTQMDVLKAIIESVPFMCHQADKRGEICHGWYAAGVELRRREELHGPLPVTTCPWPFSPPDDREEP